MVNQKGELVKTGLSLYKPVPMHLVDKKWGFDHEMVSSYFQEIQMKWLWYKFHGNLIQCFEK